MAIYYIEDLAHDRIVKVDMDVHERVENLVPALTEALDLPTVDHLGEALIYLLSYDGRFLLKEETLTSARLPGESTLRLVGFSI